MQIIDDVKSKGGKILSFTSYCGGLPAPDSNNNPLGYKFSWSARGVLLASTNNAIFLQDGTLHTPHPFFSFSFPATKARSYRR
jgi:saccharopine dehydrogenase (NADP+, L-glutamate forming)